MTSHHLNTEGFKRIGARRRPGESAYGIPLSEQASHKRATNKPCASSYANAHTETINSSADFARSKSSSLAAR
jgi:hypothetical protein